VADRGRESALLRSAEGDVRLAYPADADDPEPAHERRAPRSTELPAIFLVHRAADGSTHRPDDGRLGAGGASSTVGRKARDKRVRRRSEPSSPPVARPASATSESSPARLPPEAEAEFRAVAGDAGVVLQCTRCGEPTGVMLGTMGGPERDGLAMAKVAPSVSGYVCGTCDSPANGAWQMRVAAAAGVQL
jgi:hypothetical protein